MHPKILVGCPTYEGKSYCLDPFSQGVRKLAYPNMDILLVDNSKKDDYARAITAAGLPVTKIPWHESAQERIVQSRNLLREKVLEGGYDFFFSLEQDVIPEPDTIKKLLSHQKKVVTGVVVGAQMVDGKPTLVPLVYSQPKGNNEEDALWYLPSTEINKPQLIQVKAAALGCMLIHRSVLEEIKFRYNKGFDDMMFSKDCLLHGINMWCDTTVQPKHYSKPMEK
ncbi:MAG: hypothetical protein ABIA93_00790 [Candidatus Woesearchaeota archaeon]